MDQFHQTLIALMMNEETKLDLDGATASQEEDGGDIKDQTSDHHLACQIMSER